MSVYFHGNFGLSRDYMAGVLKTCLENPRATGDEIAAPFGYRAPFTARYKSWLNKTGLTTEGGVVELTPFGKVVWEHDPKLQSLITQWLLHHELCTDPERAEAWHFFANKFVPSRNEFGIEDLQDGLSMKLMPHHPTHFGRGSTMIKVIARKIVQCYTEDSALGQLGVLKKSDNNRYDIVNPSQQGPWSSPTQLRDAYS